MKQLLIYAFTWLLCTGTLTAQGKFAGNKKTLIGQAFSNADKLPELKGWSFVEGNLVNTLDDPERITCNVYQKGTSWLVFFSIMKDTASGIYKVMDVVAINQLAKGWTVRGSFCRLNGGMSNYLVAVGKINPDPYMKNIVKAWRFNPDKRRFEWIPVKGIDCENIGC